MFKILTRLARFLLRREFSCPHLLHGSIPAAGRTGGKKNYLRQWCYITSRENLKAIFLFSRNCWNHGISGDSYIADMMLSPAQCPYHHYQYSCKLPALLRAICRKIKKADSLNSISKRLTNHRVVLDYTECAYVGKRFGIN